MNRQRCLRTRCGLLARLWIVIMLLLLVAPVPALGGGANPSAGVSALAAARPVVGEVAKLVADDAADNRDFGNAVDVSGDTVVIGAPDDSISAPSAGTAYVFVRNEGGADVWSQVAKLTASDASERAYFGFDVAISGDTIVVGAYGDDAFRGAAYVFERNEGGVDSWGQVRKLLTNGGTAGDYFGEFVYISGDAIVVGAPMANGGGAAYVFERNWGGVPDTWGQVAEPAPTTPLVSGARFGWAVAISGGTAVVGAHRDGSPRTGSAYIFERNQGGADNWGEVRKITGDDTADADQFGYAVDIHVDTVVVGARYHDDLGSATGAAYVFERNVGGADGWGQVRKLTAGDSAEGDEFGYAVAVEAGSVLVGSPGADVGEAILAIRISSTATRTGRITGVR